MTRRAANNGEDKTTATRSSVPLTDRQADVLEFIYSEIEEDDMGRSPTVSSIAFKFSISRAAAWKHVEALRVKEFVISVPDAARSVRVTRAGELLVRLRRRRREARKERV